MSKDWGGEEDASWKKKREYQHIDPLSVNMEAYARDLYGEQMHHGDIREYNTADNPKHPDNDATVEWLGRPGTIFTTDAPGYEGKYTVVDLPRVVKFKLSAVVQKADVIAPSIVLIPMDVLGVVSDDKNLMAQVVTKVIHKPQIGKESRKKISTGSRQ